MSFKLKNMALATLVALAAAPAMASFQAAPAASAAAASGQDASSLADQIVQKLETSGALDRMLDKAVDRRIQRDQADRAKAQEEQARKASLMSRNARPVSPARDHIYGNEKAEISVIVYSDLECPFCKRFDGVPEAAIKQFGAKVNMVWRHYPLPMHGEVARKEAVVAECVAKQAGDEGFFKFIHQVFEKTALNGKGVPNGDEGLLSLAKLAGAKDEKAFDACMRDPKMASLVDEDLQDGAKSGVRGTPGTIVRVNKTGASMGVPGAIPQAQLEGMIRQAISGQGEFAAPAKNSK